MQVYTNIDALQQFDKPVITTGTFDGVHQGHLKILEQLVQEAREINGTPIVITFHPHPREVLLQHATGISVLERNR